MIDDPKPRNPDQDRSPDPSLKISGCISLPRDFSLPREDFFEVLDKRESARAFSELQLIELSTLLFLTQRARSYGPPDSDITYTPCPSAGGLASVRCLVVGHSSGTWIYERNRHVGNLLNVGLEPVEQVLRAANAIFPVGNGCLILFFALRPHIEHYYSSPESLVLRESGGVGATIGLTATALGLSFRLLGTLGTEWVSELLDLKTSAVIATGAAIVGGKERQVL